MYRLIGLFKLAILFIVEITKIFDIRKIMEIDEQNLKTAYHDSSTIYGLVHIFIHTLDNEEVSYVEKVSLLYVIEEKLAKLVSDLPALSDV